VNHAVFTTFVCVLVLLVNIVILCAFLSMFRPWLQAFLSATPVSVFEILGMRLRRTDVSAVLRSLIMARQAGVALTCRQAEMAYLQGADLEKLTLALIQAKRQGVDVTLEELLEADRDHRLSQKLSQPDRTDSEPVAASSPPAATETARPAVRICTKCSKQVFDDSKICRSCGAIL
jgi:uncharacterized protein YqfA (UPF0365 family)